MTPSPSLGVMTKALNKCRGCGRGVKVWSDGSVGDLVKLLPEALFWFLELMAPAGDDLILVCSVWQALVVCNPK